MKQLLLAIRELSATLMAKIAKNEVAIASAGGVKFISGKDALSFEEAQKVQNNYLEYKKESSRFMADQTKIVVPKKVLFNILNKGLLNLYVVQPLDNKGETRVSFVKEVDGARDEMPHFFASLLVTCFLFAATFNLGQVIFSHTYLFVLHFESTEKFEAITISALVFLLSLVFFSTSGFSVRNRIIKARKKFFDLNLKDLFSGSISEYDPRRLNLRLLFKQSIDYRQLLSKAIEFEGAVGHFILKKGPFINRGIEPRVNNSGKAILVYSGPYVPAIFLKHSVIFDVSFIDVFSEDQLTAGCMSMIEFIEITSKVENLKYFL